MSVIVVGMNEPERCKDCYLSAGYSCEIKGQIMTMEEMKKRDADCRIKSVDGLIEKIKGLPKTYPFVNHFDMYVKEDDVIKVIREYCEVER